jgi:hypothetical protein
MKKLIFPLICLCITMLSTALVYRMYNERLTLQWKAIGYETVMREQQKIDNIGRTLELAYGLSPCEAWTRAQIYEHFAREFVIEWMVYPAVAWTESRFERYPLSEKGAIGEMQCMERWVKEACDTLKIRYKRGETLKDQIRNIWIGCAMLSLFIVDKGDSTGICRYNGTGQESKDFQISVSGEQAKLREIYQRISK